MKDGIGGLTCLYCNEVAFDVGKGSREHVILSALGGRKYSRNICCERCNKELGDQIDAPLARQFAPFCNLLNIRSGRNKAAPILKRAGERDGRSIDILPGGGVQFSDRSFRGEIDKAGTATAIASGRTREETERMLFDFAARHGKKPEEVNVVHRKLKTLRGFQISFPFSLGPELFRAIAKMALSYLATLVSPAKLRSDSLSSVIEFIRHGTSSGEVVFLDHSSLLDNYTSICAVIHRVFIWATPGETAVGAVEIFGNFRFVVLLSKVWTGPVIAKCHIVDPTTGEKSEVDVESPSDIGALLVQSPFRREQIAQKLNSLRREISNRQRKRDVAHIVQKVLNRHWETGEDGVKFVRMDDKVLSDLTRETMHYLLGIDTEEDIT